MQAKINRQRELQLDTHYGAIYVMNQEAGIDPWVFSPGRRVSYPLHHRVTTGTRPSSCTHCSLLLYISCLPYVSVYLFFGVLLMLYVVQNVCEIPVLDLGRFFRGKDDSVNDDLYSMDTRRLSEHTEYKQTDTESYQKDSSRSEDDQSVD